MFTDCVTLHIGCEHCITSDGFFELEELPRYFIMVYGFSIADSFATVYLT